MAIPSAPAAATEENTEILGLQKAHSTLQEALPLLDGFHHRNKNQHRVARWWAELGLLRRHVRKLSDELKLDIEQLQKEQRSRSKKEGKRKSKSGSQTSAKDVISLTANARAKWMRHETMPRIYQAFTQLAADNQHAPLGLFLLGIQAQIYTALGSILHVSDDEDVTMGTLATSDSHDVVKTPSRDASSPLPEKPVAEGRGRTMQAGEAPASATEDLGVAISREEEEYDEGLAVGKPSSKKLRHVSPTHAASSGRKGGSSRRQDEERSLDTPSRPKKKKKKRSGGDEFDDLFSGLV